MKFSQFLNEAPYIMDISKNILKDKAIKYFKKLKEIKNRQEVYRIGSNIIYKHSENNEWYYYAFDEKENDFIFLSIIRKFIHPFNKEKHIYRQSLILANPSFKSHSPEIFMNVILEDFGEIVSDDSQTVGGKAFWKKILFANSKSSKYEIGYMDAEDNTEKVFDPNKIEKQFEYLYSDSQDYSYFYIKKK